MGSIREALADAAGSLGGRWIWGIAPGVRLADAGWATCLASPAAALDDRSVVVAVRDQFAAALVLIELDGAVRRLVLCTPDVTPQALAEIAARAGADAIVSDGDPADAAIEGLETVRCASAWTRGARPREPHRETEWMLFTSGTAGAAKMVRHTFATLTDAIGRPASGTTPAFSRVWGTFYDIRRYGGLQVLLRAVVGGGSLIIGSADETIVRHINRLAALGATHVSGTPSHWRRVLMCPNAAALAPNYIRLSGEIADQAILDALAARFPRARIVHAFASTEAGVGFEVDDGRAGFPATFVGASGGAADLRVENGSLLIRSRRTALGYADEADGALADPDGFVDTGDMVERRGSRYYFLGRRSGVINVGGLKVHPEEVEAAINRHPSVRMSKVHSKPNPISGALVAAEVVLDNAADADDAAKDILQMCRDMLPPHKVPSVVRVVPALDVARTGKLARHGS
jgi:acyl-coenzyme A synthetase/AMP-(fatty) acid ligase